MIRGLSIAGDRIDEFGIRARAGPSGEAQPRHFLCQFLEEGFRHIAAVLFALLVVEELDVVPHLLLLAGCERGDLLSLERFRFLRGSLERVVFDPQLPGADVVTDQRAQCSEREVLADRALQVAEVLQGDRRAGVAERVSVLRNTADQSRDFGGDFMGFVARGGPCFRAAAGRHAGNG